MLVEHFLMFRTQVSTCELTVSNVRLTKLLADFGLVEWTILIYTGLQIHLKLSRESMAMEFCALELV